MGAFEYTALDAGGRERKGILEGDTARQVRQLLRDRQLFAVSVTAKRVRSPRTRSRARWTIWRHAGSVFPRTDAISP